MLMRGWGGRTYDVNKSAPACVGAAAANEVARLSRSLIFNFVLQLEHAFSHLQVLANVCQEITTNNK